MKYLRALKIFKAIVAEDTAQYKSHPEDADALARRAHDKAEHHKGALRRVWDDLITFLRMLRAWATGNYKLLPWKSLSLIIGAVLYFMSPIDMIPDFLPGLGLMDDAFIITWVMRMIRRDVAAFREWESV
jgi:uncharacterized membrane protein YkvA (DUF1232 family)